MSEGLEVLVVGGDHDRVIGEVVDVVVGTAPKIREGLVGRREPVGGEENPSGDTQMEADIRADELLADRLTGIEGIGEYASEERESVVDCGEGLSVAVDPLDGSSNLVSNNPMGTIFGVYAESIPAPGSTLVAAGYVCFGPVTTMVVATDNGVAEYEIAEGQLRLLEGSVTLPAEPTVYGFGGRVPGWSEEFEEFAREVETECKPRYGGAMVADVNQVLSYGGIFSYPALDSRPSGKLRLQFEGNPIGYIIERAGGRSSDGEGSLLERDASDLHGRTPVHVGSPELIDRLEDTLA